MGEARGDSRRISSCLLFARHSNFMSYCLHSILAVIAVPIGSQTNGRCGEKSRFGKRQQGRVGGGGTSREDTVYWTVLLCG